MEMQNAFIDAVDVCVFAEKYYKRGKINIYNGRKYFILLKLNRKN